MLESWGHTLLRHNYHTGRVEIDLITYFQETVRFIEVKAYQNADYSAPLAFLQRQKQGYLRAIPLFFLELAQACRQGEEPYASLFSGVADFGQVGHGIDFCGLNATYQLDYYADAVVGV